MILNIIMAIILEFLLKQTRCDTVKDITPIIFLPVINWILIAIFPLAIIILGAEYLGNKFCKLLDKIG